MLDQIMRFFRVEEALAGQINVSVAVLRANDEASISTRDSTSGGTRVVLQH